MPDKAKPGPAACLRSVKMGIISLVGPRVGISTKRGPETGTQLTRNGSYYLAANITQSSVRELTHSDRNGRMDAATVQGSLCRGETIITAAP